MLQRLLSAYSTTIDVREFVFHLLLTALLGYLLSMLYVFTARNRSGARRLGRLFPLIALTMALLSTVISSSLAISIGLVGALSVVRYRARIDDIEQLVFLFFAIALGLAGGTGQVITGFLGLLLIGGVLTLRQLTQKGQPRHIAIHVQGAAADMAALMPSLTASFPELELRHYHTLQTRGEWTFLLPSQQPDVLLQLHALLTGPSHDLKFSFRDDGDAA